MLSAAGQDVALAVPDRVSRPIYNERDKAAMSWAPNKYETRECNDGARTVI
jgi:hypothetical protein